MTVEELTADNAKLKAELEALKRERENWIRSTSEISGKLIEAREGIRAVLEGME